MKSFQSNGKLLLTGEYAILDGALGLGMPTRFGQSMTVSPLEKSLLVWTSYDEKGAVWFKGVYNLESFSEVSSSDSKTSKSLLKILREARNLNPFFLVASDGYEVDSKLDFPKNWGLGSSSTLINNIAQWAEVDAFELSNKSFGGSGYDIACAQNGSPILYRLNNRQREVKKVNFNPGFKKNLWFVHLNEKQDSRKEIARYTDLNLKIGNLIEEISTITDKTVRCDDLEEFEELLNRHEALLSKALKLPTIKESRFPDFQGTIKSLGAWGGDFVLAIGDEATPDYFKKKGYTTVIPFDDMVLKS